MRRARGAARWRGRLLVAALVVAASACGSTLEKGTTVASDDTTFGPAADDGDPTDADAGVTPGVDAGGEPGADGSAGAGRPTAGPGRTATTAGASSSAAPSTDGGTIDIGVYTASGATSFFEGLGVKGVTSGDHQNQVQAVVDHINANGGAGGRQINVVYHDFDIAVAATDPAAETQAACAAWTEDEHVFAVVSPIANGYMDQLHGCLSQRGVIGFNNFVLADDGFMRRYHDHFYAPSGINMTRAMRNKVHALHAVDFFDPVAPVGVVRFNTKEDERAVAEGVIPALAEHGLRAEVAVADHQGTGNEYHNMVLRFKALGVKNVIFTWTGVLLFAPAAESQDYHPRMALNSFNGPALLQANLSPEQLDGSMGIGWIPMTDVDEARDPGPVSDQRVLCEKLMNDAGEDTSSRTVLATALLFCDPFLFLDRVLDSAGEPSVDNVRNVVEGIGTSFTSASTFAAAFGPGRTHDGGNAYRIFAYDQACRCFKYTTEPQEMT